MGGGEGGQKEGGKKGGKRVDTGPQRQEAMTDFSPPTILLNSRGREDVGTGDEMK